MTRAPALLQTAIALLVAVAACGPSGEEPLRVSAAVSLTDALTRAVAVWEARGNLTVVPNFAASNILARQIAEGAPADVFISADEAQVNRLIEVGAVAAGDVLPLLSNRLVIVVPRGHRLPGEPPRSLADPAIARVAMGDPEAVPAGVYARVWLERAGLWPAVRPKAVPSISVRAALAAVESGNADAGIVYATDARPGDRVDVAWSVPTADGPRIVYPVAVVKATGRPSAARRFQAFLRGPEASRIFADAGFVPLSGPPAP